MVTHVWIIPLVVIALTQAAVVATSVYLHRTLAHRALTVHPVADILFRTVLWLTTGQSRRQWVAVENKWLATRYGLGAMYIRTPGGKRRPLAYDLSELMERLPKLVDQAARRLEREANRP